MKSADETPKLYHVDALGNGQWLYEGRVYTPDEFMHAFPDAHNIVINDVSKDKTGLERYTPIKADKHSMLTAKVANSHHLMGMDILKERSFNAQLAFVVAEDIGHRREQALAIVGLNYDGIELTGQTRLCAFDKAVYNTVCTLWQAGNVKMSARDIFNAMNGYTGIKAKSGQVERINNSIRKYMGTVLTLDVTDEINKLGIKFKDERIAKGTIQTNMLHATRVAILTENGRDSVGYKILEEPILYTYAKAKRQILTVDARLLDTSDTINGTEDIVILREYLLQQIENMRNARGFRTNRKILYRDVYEKTGLEHAESRVEQQRLRESVKGVLESWKRRGYIKDFTDARSMAKGRPVMGVEIILLDEQ